MWITVQWAVGAEGRKKKTTWKGGEEDDDSVILQELQVLERLMMVAGDALF